MKILITGVSGYLGLELSKKLYNHEIIGLDIKKPKEELPDNVTFLKKSVLDENLDHIFSDYRPDICIHLAWTVTPVHKKNLKKAYNVDYNGTKNIFNLCKKFTIQYIIFMSSTLAYGALKDNSLELTEEDPLRAKKSFHYAYHKRLVENEIVQPFIQENPSIIVTVIRAPGFLGPMVTNYIAGILRSKFLPVMIGGRNTQIQFLHINDLLDIFELFVEKKISGTFNITPNDAIAMKKVSKILPGFRIYIPEFLARLGVSILWFFHMYKAPSSYLDFVRYPFVASNTKAKQKLGWEPKFTTKKSLESLFNE